MAAGAAPPAAVCPTCGAELEERGPVEVVCKRGHHTPRLEYDRRRTVAAPPPAAVSQNGHGAAAAPVTRTGATHHTPKDLRDPDFVIGLALQECTTATAQPEPAPRRHAWEGLIPDGGVATIYYGDSDTYKTYLAGGLAQCVAAGRPFLGRATDGPRTVLWLDFEMDYEEWQRRMYAIARGLGGEDALEALPPATVRYWHPPAGLSIAAESLQAAVRALITEHEAGFVVLDSLTVALMEGDAREAEVLNPALKAIEAWGVPSLLIDHIRGAVPGVAQSQLNPYGTIFKRHAARSLLQVFRSEGGGLVLRHKKFNFGVLAPPFGIGVTLEPDPQEPRRVLRATFETRDLDDASLVGTDEHLSMPERVCGFIRSEGGAAAERVQTALGLRTLKTAKNYCSLLAKEGRVALGPDGVYREVERHRSAPDGG